jgi:hypothetical protein
MSRRDDYKLDSLVRSALRTGPIRPTPFGLHGRIWRRLEIAAMVERERKRFRAAVRRSCFIIALLAATLAGICWVWDPLASAIDDLPGSMGLVDYMRAYLETHIAGMLADADTWIGAGIAITLVIVLVLGSRSRLGNHIRRY